MPLTPSNGKGVPDLGQYTVLNAYRDTEGNYWLDCKNPALDVYESIQVTPAYLKGLYNRDQMEGEGPGVLVSSGDWRVGLSLSIRGIWKAIRFEVLDRYLDGREE